MYYLFVVPTHTHCDIKGTFTNYLCENVSNSQSIVAIFHVKLPSGCHHGYTHYMVNLLPARQGGAIILPASQYMNHHLPASIAYQLADLYHLADLKPPTVLFNIYFGKMAEVLWGYVGTSVE